ncbi:hypothetical protein OKW42_003620 [Paraburkholderia sp. WC7.3d]
MLCVRWYVAYSLSPRNQEEMMAERGFEADHSTVHRWVIKLVPLFEKAFRQHKRPVSARAKIECYEVNERTDAKTSGAAANRPSKGGCGRSPSADTRPGKRRLGSRV